MFYTDTVTWAHTLFADAPLGDPRRNKRLITYLSDQAEAARRSTASVCSSDARRLGAYRLLHNAHFDTEALQECAFAHTLDQVAGLPRVLAVGDATTLSYGHSVRTQLGLIGKKGEAGHRRGYLVYSVLLVDPENGLVYGLADQQWWLRSVSAHGQRHRRYQRSYPQKESYIWEASSRRLAQRTEGRAPEMISVCDRGADVYEYIQYKTEQQEGFIVRSNQDRVLTRGQKLSVHLAQVPPFAQRLLVEVAGRKAPAVLEIRSSVVELQPPERWGCPEHPPLHPVPVQVVEVNEVNLPPGVQPLRWRLYTSLAVDTFEAALLVVRYYRFRWRIEEWHKAWKSECGVEERRLRSRAALQRLAVLLGWIAVRVMQLQQLEETDPEAPSTCVLTPLEAACLWAATEEGPFPDPVPDVRWVKQALARLGNFYDSRRTGRPGRQTLQRGLWRLEEICLGWQLAHKQKDDL